MAEWEAMLTGDGAQFAHTIELVGLDGFIDLASLRMFDCVLTGDFVGADAVVTRAEHRIEQISSDRRVMNTCQADSLTFISPVCRLMCCRFVAAKHAAVIISA
jgi:hypothetical protein